ncbi:MAG TPA: hypothetical protein VD833_04830 [Vicinamibacterales bacterium]|nr:hypothetical protein [Vicinamibacterales bacterium]
MSEEGQLKRRLAQYEEELARMRQENELLRQSVQTFRELARRLNLALTEALDDDPGGGGADP